MRKFILAALVALPLSIPAPQRASADDHACCFSTPPIGLTVGFRFKLSGGLLIKGPPCCSGCSLGCGGCGPCGGCGGCGRGSCGPAAPWYAYWPQDAHFQTPAPTGYPYWPSPMSPMMGGHASSYAPPPAMAYGYGYGPPPFAMAYGPSYGPPAPAMALPMAPAMNYAAPPMVQPCSYFPNQAPSYWYGR